jgi:acetylornithine deacetylase/succinyl-diaminopimelate desuccinylase-like protein
MTPSTPPAAGFEAHVARCCALPEPALRGWLRASLEAQGFRVEEDDYQARNQSRWDRSGVHNMLAVRGAPVVAFVAHTDVCRDLGDPGCAPDPVVRQVFRAGRARRVLQDREQATQIGGDDRLGVALISWLAATRRDLDLALLFTTDEEVGLLSAAKVPAEWLGRFALAAQVDRGNRPSPELVTRILELPLCSPRTASWLLELAASLGLPRTEVKGLRTDVYALRKRAPIEAVNMTCGYHASHNDGSGEEYIDLAEALETLMFLEAIAAEAPAYMLRRDDAAAHG